MEFKKIEINDNKHYEKYLSECIQIPSDLTPLVLYGYANTDHIERAYADGFCWHRCTDPEDPFYMPPIGNWDCPNWQEILDRNVPAGTSFRYVPEYLLNTWVTQVPKYLDFDDTREDWDYIYYINRFDETTRKNIKKMQKAADKFKNQYNYSTQPITKENLPILMEIQERECAKIRERTSNLEELNKENDAFHRVFNAWSEIDTLSGFILFIDEKPVAFTTVEKIDENNIINLFEKADRNYRGIFDFLNIHILDMAKEEGHIIANAMSDAGSEGLRTAKTSQLPLVMLKKYRVRYR